MLDATIYRDMMERTGGGVYIGVVGPVRTGKSTFIKRFMETMVLPNLDDVYVKERARDELPQSGSGRTIMTAEPKFVPEQAVPLPLDDKTSCLIRMVDSVGYMVEGAAGNMEDGAERMVVTPWYEEEVPMSRAAEEGTRRVIEEHSTVGILVTTDGSVCGIPREAYEGPEAKAAAELNRIGKPYVILLNCAEPNTESASELAQSLSERYGRRCLPVNCQTMEEAELAGILKQLLYEFPVTRMEVYLPAWMDALDSGSRIRGELFSAIMREAEETRTMGDMGAMLRRLQENNDMVSAVSAEKLDLGSGVADLSISLPQKLYYETVSEESGFPIRNDRDLMLLLRSVSGLQEEYERVHAALEDVRTKGYGIVMPTLEEMTLEEPQIVRQGGRYGVKLKASAPSIHMIMANIETEVSPAIGGERASEEVINFLLQGYDGDINRIWESNIFGKALNDIAGEGLTNKIKAMPAEAQGKLQTTIQRIVNEGSGGLICILL